MTTVFASRIRRGAWRVGLRPRTRGRELTLLLLLAAALAAGWASLGANPGATPGWRDAVPLLVYLGALGLAHVAFVLSGRDMDQLLLPVAGLLGGLSLLLMLRLPQVLVEQTWLGLTLGLAQLQLLWLVLAVGLAATVAVLVRDDRWLRGYKYTWAMVGLALLLLVFVFGEEANGARLSLRVGPFAGQPSELLKVVLVVFLAAYLADHRATLARASYRLGPLALPPLPYLLPMLALWGLALAMIIVQRDLGAALLLYSVFLALLYVATRRAAYVVLGVGLFILGALALYGAFPHVRARVDLWLDPWADPLGSGFQVTRALFALGRGGLLGTGLGAGLPSTGTSPGIPAVHTDFVFAALAEELGMLGGVAICAAYLVIAERGLRVAARADDAFGALLATGLTLVVVLQAAIIIGGNLAVVPLTGVTLPLLSYGGSSLLTNALVLGLLLALSDRLGRRLAPPPGLRAGRAGRPDPVPVPSTAP